MKSVTYPRLLLPRPATTSGRCFQNGYLVRIYHAWSLFLIWSVCSSIVHLADTRPHSLPPLPTSPSPHTSIIGSSHTIYGEAGPARRVSTYLDDALNPPYAIASAPHSRRHASAFTFTLSRHRYWPAEDDRTKQVAKHVKHVHGSSNSQPNSNPNPSHTHQHHCERHYDYDPTMCRSTVVIPCSSGAKSMGMN